MTVRKIFGIYYRMIKFQIKSQASFGISMLMDIISTSFYGLTEIIGLLLIINQLGSISEWTTWEIAYLLAIAEFSFGCMDLVFSGFDPDYFAPNVRKGNLDTMMLRPLPLTLQVLGSRFVLRRFGRIITGFLVMVLTISHLSINWDVGKIIYVFIIILSQITLFGSFFIFGSTITFWTIERIEAVNIITYGGREVITYPMEIFPRWLRDIFTFVIPFLFINYAPALYILEKREILNLPAFSYLIAPLIGLLFMVGSFLFWNFGKKYYQGTGT